MAENKPDEKPAAPMPANAVRPMSPDEIRQAEAAEQARIVAEVAERDASNGPEGGRFLVNDVLVNSEGVPLKDVKK